MLLQSINKYANMYLSVEKTQQRGGVIVMFDYKKLRGKIREVFGTEKQFAKALGISSTSLSLKFNGEASFKQSQISRCCELLGIPVKEIGQYFFCPIS